MKRGTPFDPFLLKCPQCRKHFARLADLNLHLRNKHEARYAVMLPTRATDVARPVPRVKRGGPRRPPF